MRRGCFEFEKVGPPQDEPIAGTGRLSNAADNEAMMSSDLGSFS